MDHVEDLKRAENRIAAARQALADAYQHRTEVAQVALDAGMTKKAIGDALGVVRPAVNKILAGQDGMPARKGWTYP
jgi:hypothetical protein